MLAPRSLITLASGRLTRLNRVALALGLGLFVATILLVRPVHEPSPSMVQVRATVRALDQGSPLLDRASLLDASSLFMAPSQPDVRSIDAAQPDAAPFQSFGPELSPDPSKSLATQPEGSLARWPELSELFPLAGETPFATIGQKSARSLPKARTLHVEVYSEKSETVIRRTFSASDPLLKNHKELIDSGLRASNALELSVGVDAFGIQANPSLLRSSGDEERDRRAVEWARTLPWGGWLRAGSYRVVIGP